MYIGPSFPLDWPKTLLPKEARVGFLRRGNILPIKGQFRLLEPSGLPFFGAALSWGAKPQSRAS